MAAIPTYEYFVYFAYKDPSDPFAAVEYPITPDQAMNRTGLENPHFIIQRPPAGWMAVYRSDQPVVPDLFKLVEAEPIFNEDIGKWVQNFQLVEFSESEIQQFYTQLRKSKELEINASREAANTDYFIYEGHRIACDSLSMRDIMMSNMLVLDTGALPTPWPGAWKTKDGGFVPITDVATWKRFFASIYTQGALNFQHSETLKHLLAQATSIAEIRGINWETDTGVAHS